MLLAQLKNGACEKGDNGSDPTEIPPWLDLEKFNRGRQFFRDHFTSIALAMYCSLVCGLGEPNLLDALVYTGRSDTPKKALKRYFSTIKHVVLWHLGNVWDPRDPAFQSVQSVRQMHSVTAQKLNQAQASRLYVTQYDMALVQCGFMGGVVLYRQFGCIGDGIEDYIHFWRGIGYLLGMEDRFNICSGTYQETYDICKEIELEVVRPCLIYPPQHFRKMADAFIVGSNIPLPFPIFTYDSVLAFVFRMWKDECYNFEREHCQLTMTDRFRVFAFQLFLWTLTKFRRVESVINSWFVRRWHAFLKYPSP